jgi:hypothetical protein
VVKTAGHIPAWCATADQVLWRSSSLMKRSTKLWRLLPRREKRSGARDRCVFSNVRSAILSAHYGDDVRQRAFGDLAMRLH